VRVRCGDRCASRVRRREWRGGESVAELDAVIKRAGFFQNEARRSSYDSGYSRLRGRLAS
jgi:hypothetical protein